MDWKLVFAHGDALLISVFITLLLMSVATWWLILWRGVDFFKTRSQQRDQLHRFWHSGKAYRRELAQSDSALGRMTHAGEAALSHYQKNLAANGSCQLDDYLTRSIRQALSQETARLENGMIVLATVGSIAPFIGLFGTVWGIYRALVGIAAQGQVSIATVSGPIGEALVATAAGLAAAIPAVIAYNAFLRSNRLLSQEMDGFAHDLHAQLLAEAGE